MTEENNKVSREQIRRKRQMQEARRRKRRRKALLLRGITLGVLVLLLIGSIGLIRAGLKGLKNKKQQAADTQEQQNAIQDKKEKEKNFQLTLAENAAKGYDYSRAVSILSKIEEEDSTGEIAAKIKEYESIQSDLVAADVQQIPHVFFHSLVVDPAITWNLSDEDAYKVSDYNQVMTTVEEFKKILQQLYDGGYVLVRLHDLVEEVKDDEGNVTFTEGKIMLPKGKKPLVMSQDDLCYYLYMEGDGFASRMVVGEDGRPTTEYVQPDGSTVTGAYDLVPILNAFIDEHPDFSYQGAKAVLAFTGYNGILGYRTDPDLGKTEEEGNEYAAEHGTFNVEEEMAAVKPVIEAIKKDGWELASHSYGHISYGSDLSKVKEDDQKWQERVANLIGSTDILIFPFGTDIGGWDEYSDENEKYTYLRKQGFRFFCNVDSSEYWVQQRPEYLRQGRRNLDGYRMYQDLYNDAGKLSDLFDVQSVYDSTRPKTGLESWEPDDIKQEDDTKQEEE